MRARIRPPSSGQLGSRGAPAGLLDQRAETQVSLVRIMLIE